MGKTAAWIFLSLTVLLAAYGIVITVMWNKEKTKNSAGPAKPATTPRSGAGAGPLVATDIPTMTSVEDTATSESNAGRSRYGQ